MADRQLSDFTITLASDPAPVAGGFEVQVRHLLPEERDENGEMVDPSFSESYRYDGKPESLARLIAANPKVTPPAAPSHRRGDVLDVVATLAAAEVAREVVPDIPPVVPDLTDEERARQSFYADLMAYRTQQAIDSLPDELKRRYLPEYGPIGGMFR